jgi:hypothetical protein
METPMTPALKRFDRRSTWAGGKRRSPPRKDPSFRLLEAEIGLQELMAVLALSGEPRALSLLDLLSDPAYSRHTLASLCKRVGLSFIRIFDIYRRAQINRGTILMASHLPGIMEDIAIDSLTRSVTCHGCAGSGRASINAVRSSDAICAACGGSGIMCIPGDAASRKLFMKLMKAIPPKDFMSPKPVHNLPSLEETFMQAESILEVDHS